MPSPVVFQKNNTPSTSTNSHRLHFAKNILHPITIVQSGVFYITKVLLKWSIHQVQQKIDNSISVIVAIFTNPHIFYYLEGSTRSCVDEPECNSQLLAMVTEMKHLFSFVFFFFHVVLNKFSTRHVPFIMHEP
jgi:hypothetical protein